MHHRQGWLQRVKRLLESWEEGEVGGEEEAEEVADWVRLRLLVDRVRLLSVSGRKCKAAMEEGAGGNKQAAATDCNLGG